MSVITNQTSLLIAWHRTNIYNDIFASKLTRAQWQRWPLSADYFSTAQLQQLLPELGIELPRGLISYSTWQRVVELVVATSWIPWIDSLWITGSVAAGVASPDDDLDICVVTDPHRLWLTRLLVIMTAFLMCRYRWATTTAAQARHRWCFNLWLESDSLALWPERQTVYTARELVQARLVFARWDSQREKWLEDNKWVQFFTQRGWWWSRQMVAHFLSEPWSAWKTVIRWSGWGGFWRALNAVACYGQTWYMRARQTREQVTSATAFFHPRDTQFWVVRKYEQQTAAQGVPTYDV